MPAMLLKVDCPLFVADETAEADNPLISFVKTAEQAVGGRKRLYYAAVGLERILIVMRNGVRLDSLNTPGSYVRALVGDEPGTPGFVLPAHEEKWHTKITVDARWTLDSLRAVEQTAKNYDLEIGSLTEVLNEAPRAPSPTHGGARPGAGRPPKSEDERMRYIQLTLPAADIATLSAIGDGGVSAGVRRLVDEWRQRNEANNAPA